MSINTYLVNNKNNIFLSYKPLQQLFFQFSYKTSEKNYVENQLKKINKDLYILKQDLFHELNNFVYHEHKDELLESHQHYQNKHRLKIDSENYYDNDWMKFKYGVEIPINDDGSTLAYDGPNLLVWITCDECKITLKKECFQKCNEEFNLYKTGEEEFERHILQQKLTEYKKELFVLS